MFRKVLHFAGVSLPALRAAWLFAAAVLLVSGCSSFKGYQSTIIRWEPEIRAFEAEDSAKPPADNAILFVGSSTIRLWDTAETDMAPWPVLRRGYGGAKISDLAWYIRRLTHPYRIRALVIFVANDIGGYHDDKTPAQIKYWFEYIVKAVRERHPRVPLFYVAVTPSPKRWHVWSAINAGNAMVRMACSTMPGVYFVPTQDLFLHRGRPDPALFREDGLHLSREGYRLWSERVRFALQSVIGSKALERD